MKVAGSSTGGTALRRARHDDNLTSTWSRGLLADSAGVWCFSVAATLQARWACGADCLAFLVRDRLAGLIQRGLAGEEIAGEVAEWRAAFDALHFVHG